MDISDAVDGMYFGFVVSAVLLGITVVQGWTYLQANRDQWLLRSLITALLLLDVAETFCSTQIVHHYLIEQSGDLEALQSSTNIVATEFVITLIIMFLVHLFFVTRLFIINKSRCFTMFILLLSLTTFVMGIVMFPHHLANQHLSNFSLMEPKVQLVVFHSLAAVTDICVTISLSYTCTSAQKVYENTRMLFRRLLVYALSRGLLIVGVQVAHIIMYLLNPGNFLFWVSLHFCLGKVYVITTLFILNARFSLRDSIDDTGGTIHLTFTSMTSGHVTHDDPEDPLEFGKKDSKAQGLPDAIAREQAAV